MAIQLKQIHIKHKGTENEGKKLVKQHMWRLKGIKMIKKD